MKKIKKALRLFVLICLIVLACIGIGISGGVPLSLTSNRRETQKEKKEIVEEQVQKSASKQANFKK